MLRAKGDFRLNGIKEGLTGPYCQHFLSTHFKSALPSYEFIKLCEKHHNIPRSVLVEAADLEETLFDHPESKISLFQIMQLRAEVSEYLSPIDIGLLWGEACSIQKLWQYGRYIGTARNIEEAIICAVELNKWLEYLPFNFHLIEKNGRAQICVPFKLHDCGDGLLVAENAVIMKWMNLLTHVGFPDYAKITFSVTFPQPTNIECYDFLGGHSIEFGKRTLKIEFSEEILHIDNPNYDQEAHELSRRSCAKHIESKAFASDVFTDQLLGYLYERWLKNIGSVRDISIERAADYFDISPATLHRNLKREEAGSFKRIVFEGKMELAAYYLASTKYSIEEISNRIGYNNDSNFIRAFTGWAKIYPKQYRDDILSSAHN